MEVQRGLLLLTYASLKATLRGQLRVHLKRLQGDLSLGLFQGLRQLNCLGLTLGGLIGQRQVLAQHYVDEVLCTLLRQSGL